MAELSALPSVDLYASAVAYLQHFPYDRRQDVLVRLFGDAGGWQKLATAGAAALSERGMRERFTTRLADAKARLKAERPQVEDLRPLTAPAIVAQVALSTPGSVQSAAPSPAPSAFSPPSAAPIEPRLSLRDYAALRAATVDGGSADRARAQYGLDERSDALEVEAWRQKFAAHPALLEEYRALFRRSRVPSADASYPPVPSVTEVSPSPRRSASPPSPPLPPSPSLPLAPTPVAPTVSVPTPPPPPMARPSPASFVPAPPVRFPSSSFVPAPPPPPAVVPSVPPRRPSAAPAAATPFVPEAPGMFASVPSTGILTHVMSLGEHAQFAAEILCLPAETVYAKYDLTDADLRGAVLCICEDRLKDPAAMATWKRLHEMALSGLRGKGRTDKA